MSVSFQDPETDIMDQFLGPETDIMGERNFMHYFSFTKKTRLSSIVSQLVKVCAHYVSPCPDISF